MQPKKLWSKGRIWYLALLFCSLVAAGHSFFIVKSDNKNSSAVKEIVEIFNKKIGMQRKIMEKAMMEERERRRKTQEEEMLRTSEKLETDSLKTTDLPKHFLDTDYEQDYDDSTEKGSTKALDIRETSESTFFIESLCSSDCHSHRNVERNVVTTYPRIADSKVIDKPRAFLFGHYTKHTTENSEEDDYDDSSTDANSEQHGDERSLQGAGRKHHHSTDAHRTHETLFGEDIDDEEEEVDEKECFTETICTGHTTKIHTRSTWCFCITNQKRPKKRNKTTTPFTPYTCDDSNRTTTVCCATKKVTETPCNCSEIPNLTLPGKVPTSEKTTCATEKKTTTEKTCSTAKTTCSTEQTTCSTDKTTCSTENSTSSTVNLTNRKVNPILTADKTSSQEDAEYAADEMTCSTDLETFLTDMTTCSVNTKKCQCMSDYVQSSTTKRRRSTIKKYNKLTRANIINSRTTTKSMSTSKKSSTTTCQESSSFCRPCNCNPKNEDSKTIIATKSTTTNEGTTDRLTTIRQDNLKRLVKARQKRPTLVNQRRNGRRFKDISFINEITSNYLTTVKNVTANVIKAIRNRLKTTRTARTRKSLKIENSLYDDYNVALNDEPQNEIDTTEQSHHTINPSQNTNCPCVKELVLNLQSVLSKAKSSNEIEKFKLPTQNGGNKSKFKTQNRPLSKNNKFLDKEHKRQMKALLKALKNGDPLLTRATADNKKMDFWKEDVLRPLTYPKNLESIGRKIYDSALAIKTDLEIANEGIKKVKQEEFLVKKGLGNLQEIKTECSNLICFVKKLKDLLEVTKIRDKVQKKINTKVHDILRSSKMTNLNKLVSNI